MVTKFGGQILATKFGFVPDCYRDITVYLEIAWEFWKVPNKFYKVPVYEYITKFPISGGL